MKILWFTNIPCGAASLIQPNLHVGGWMSSLEEQLVLSNDIDLSVCFYWKEPMASFKHKKTTYYPVYRSPRKHKFYKFLNRFCKSQSDKKEIATLLQIIKTVSPDIIHVHGTEDNFGLIQQHTSIPVVISLQGILSPYTEKFFSGIPFCKAYRYEGILPKLFLTSVRSGYIDMNNAALREQNILKQAKYVLGRTNWDRRVAKVLAPNSKYFIFEDLIRSSFYEKSWNKQQFDCPFTITSIITGGVYKGLETIVKAAQMLQQINIQYKWIIIGQNNNGAIVRIVKNWLNVDYAKLNISFVGNKNEHELIDILLKADMYCHASHIENNPNSLCEAMLLGLPVVACTAGGTDNLFENNTPGVLLQDGEPYSLAGAIAEMQENFAAAKQFGITARQNALVKHNKDMITNSLLSIYKTVTNLPSKLYTQSDDK